MLANWDQGFKLPNQVRRLLPLKIFFFVLLVASIIFYKELFLLKRIDVILSYGCMSFFKNTYLKYKDHNL